MAEKLSDISGKQYTTAEASSFMQQFFHKFPGVKNFTEKVIQSCRRSGYVQTVCRRRRYLPDICNSDPQRKAHAERQAVNTVIQVIELYCYYL